METGAARMVTNPSTTARMREIMRQPAPKIIKAGTKEFDKDRKDKILLDLRESHQKFKRFGREIISLQSKRENLLDEIIQSLVELHSF